MVLIGSVRVGVVDRFGYLRMQKSTSSNVSIGLVMGCARRFGFCWSIILCTQVRCFMVLIGSVSAGSGVHLGGAAGRALCCKVCTSKNFSLSFVPFRLSCWLF